MESMMTASSQPGGLELNDVDKLIEQLETEFEGLLVAWW
jgi:hypothetical protein